MSQVLLFAGAAISLAWGIAHIVPTVAIVRGFGSISSENKKILVMSWVAEGLALCFIGALVLFVTLAGGSAEPISRIVFRVSAGMLVIMAIWTQLTGARTSIVPIKVCPYIKTAAAILLYLGSLS